MMKQNYKITKIVKDINIEDDWNDVFYTVNKYYDKWHKINKPPIFAIGDKVSFLARKTGTHSGKHLGVVTKLNPKRAKVEVTIGKACGTWSIPYPMLTTVTKEELTELAIKKLL